MSSETQSERSVLFAGPGGSALLTHLATGVILLTASGGDDSPGSEGPMKELDDEVARAGRLTLFLNMLARDSLSSGSREIWVPWVRRHQGKIDAHVLVRSQLVEMAISVLAMLAGGVTLTSYSEPATFTDAIANVVPGFVELPAIPPMPPPAITASR